METIITEWNTLIRLGENLWLKIEEPRDQKTPTECNVTVHYENPNNEGEEDNYEDSMEIDYEYHKEQYDEQNEYEDDDDDE